MSTDPLGTPQTASSDADLLRAIAAGSEASFTELRARYGRAVARVCRSVAGVEGGEDCEQEVFARVWVKAALFDPRRGSAAAWLLTLTRRTAFNLRSRRSPPPAAVQPDPVYEPPELDGFWLGAALARLPEREPTVVELAYVEDLSETAIAKRLRVPIGSVKSWKRRGLNRLAALLGEESP
jgi:RNA polymerase sigma-70 factor (ECF subfamily)